MEKSKKPFLPVGWRTETFRLKGRERREYIDPHGKRYRTLAEAKKAIDAERTRQNIANLLKQRVAKMDALAKIQTDIGQQELTPEAKADQNVKRQKLT